MVVMKMTHMKHIPEYCDDCTYYSCRPHPYKGWSDGCELCGQCMDDDQEEDWIYYGNGRPKNCPLMEVDEAQIPENLISRDFMKEMGATCIAKRISTGELVAISSIDELTEELGKIEADKENEE